jgi:hypothetical protein
LDEPKCCFNTLIICLNASITVCPTNHPLGIAVAMATMHRGASPYPKADICFTAFAEIQRQVEKLEGEAKQLRARLTGNKAAQPAAVAMIDPTSATLMVFRCCRFAMCPFVHDILSAYHHF